MDVRGATADRCPITLDNFVDPVLLSDGHVYERTAILQWLGHHDTAPCTNVVLPHKSALKLAPLHAVVEVMLSAGSAPVRVAGRTRLEQAVRYAEVSVAPTDIGRARQASTLPEACLFRKRSRPQ